VRSPPVEWLARAGLVARGLIYAIIGVLAIEVAAGVGGRTTNPQGALHTIAREPLGKTLLAAVTAGLGGFAIWRVGRAVTGRGPETAVGWKERVSDLVAGCGYGALCATGVAILIGSRGSSGSPDAATGGVLGWPGGQLLVGLTGLVVIGVGLAQGYLGVTRRFLEESKTDEMSEDGRRAFTAIGVFGHLARMVVFALIGWFVIKAAIEFDPDKAVALDGALAKVAHAPYGPALLGLVAAGLIGFGAFSLVESRYRRV